MTAKEKYIKLFGSIEKLSDESQKTKDGGYFINNQA